MTARRWVFTAIALIVCFAALEMAGMAWVDPYGLFRSPTGRELPLFYADRMGKYLLSERYVPANFDALLIGPSSSVNWDMKIIGSNTGLRFYNESLEGGNATEEKLLVEQALPRAKFRLALIVIGTSMISTHKVEDGLEKTQTWEALGSLDSTVQAVLASMKTHHIHFGKENSTPDGSHEMRNPHGFDLGADITSINDPVGLKNLKTLISELQAQGVHVIYVVPTIYEPVLEKNQAFMEGFYRDLWTELPPAPVIDLNAPEYKSLRANPANYIDDFHVAEGGARVSSQILNDRVRKLLNLP